MRNIVIILLLLGQAFVKCASSEEPVTEAERRSLFLANNIDSGSLNLLRNFSYGAKGDDNFWLRVSGDSNLYVCNFRPEGDTVNLSIWRPHRFVQDFPTAFRFDTATYSQFTFSDVRDSIVAIKLDSSNGNSFTIDTLIKTEVLFHANNPFKTFSELTAITKKYGLMGSSYSSEIGELFIFRVAPEFKLLYIPDTLQLNPKFQEYWMDKFRKGKKIKPDWSLVEVGKA